MTRAYMIRHGRPLSSWGQDLDPDPGLDEVGASQADAAAVALMSLPQGDRPTRIVSSPLRRCRETAAPLAERLGVIIEIDRRFGEIPSPSALKPEERAPWLRAALEGRWAQVKGDIDYDHWRRSIGTALCDCAGAAVFSHFVAINAAVSCATGADAVLSFRPDHASRSVFDIRAGRMRLVEQGREAATGVL